VWFARLVRRWRWLTRCAVRDFREIYRRLERERQEQTVREWLIMLAGWSFGSVVAWWIWG